MVGGKELKMSEEDLKKELGRTKGAPTGQKWDVEADVVVVGFGGAGCAARMEL